MKLKKFAIALLSLCLFYVPLSVQSNNTSVSAEVNNFNINFVIPGSTDISGYGTTGSIVSVYFPGGKVGKATVDKWGLFKTPVPAGVKLMPRQKFKVEQKNSNGSVETKQVTVLTLIPSPKINPFKNGDTVISGTGLPNLELWVSISQYDTNKVEHKQEKMLTADAAGKWSLKLNKPLLNANIFLTQTGDSVPSPSNEYAEEGKTFRTPAIVNAIKPGAKTITGTAPRGAWLNIKFPNGKVVPAFSSNDTKWEVSVPYNTTLSANQKITVEITGNDTPDRIYRSVPNSTVVYVGGSNPVTPPKPVTPAKIPSVIYQANIQKLGWQAPAKDNSLAGAVGKNLGIETLRISLINLPVAGGISYQTYNPKTGWQRPSANNQVNGTIGLNTSIEAVNIKLTGEIAKQYDVYYRVYSRKYGWIGFAKNGGNAGSVGRGSSIDGLQVILLKKGSVVVTKNAFIDQTGKFVS